jgi:hypothetical protein
MITAHFEPVVAPNEITTPRTVLWSEPDFDVSVHNVWTPAGWVMFVHMDVFYFNATTLRRAHEAHNVLRPHLPPVIMCIGEEDDEKFEKFIARFGWRHFGGSPCSDGKYRRLFAHLKQ